MEQKVDKSLFLLILKKINKITPEACRLLRDQPMNNTKLMERSAKTLKDPNPLASTMMNITRKYPIIIDADKSEKCGVPSKYLAPKQMRKDMHYHGKILAKKEAIEWWITESKVPDDHIIKIIDILYKHHRNEVENYYSIDWTNSRIQFGPPNLERRVVRTRTPLLQIDKDIQKEAIMQTLIPDLIIPYTMVPDSIIKEVKNLLTAELSCDLRLASQIRILLQHMDPRTRVLPVLPGSLEHNISCQHAFLGSNYMVIGTRDLKSHKSNEIYKRLSEVYLCLHHLALKAFEVSLVRRAAESIRIQGLSIKEILLNHVEKETEHIKWLKTLYKMECSPEYTKDGLTTSPENASIKSYVIMNKSDVKIKVYKAVETVNFKYDDIRGYFKHGDQHLFLITCNFTTQRALRSLLCEIAVYIRYDSSQTRSRSLRGVYNEIRRSVLSNPEEFLNIGKGTLQTIKPDKNYDLGRLSIRQHSEYRAPVSCLLSFDRRFNLCSRTGSLNYYLMEPKKVIMPAAIDSRDLVLRNYLHFKRYVEMTMSHNLNKAAVIQNAIFKKDFSLYNEGMKDHLGENSGVISHICRTILNEIINKNWHSTFACFIYMFCNADPALENVDKTIFMIGNYTLDVSGNTGIFSYNEELQQYCLFGKKLEGFSEEYKIDTIGTKIILEDFRIIKFIPDAPLKSVKWLQENSDKISENTCFRVYINGVQYSAVKRKGNQIKFNETIERHLKNKQVWSRLSKDTLTSLKRTSDGKIKSIFEAIKEMDEERNTNFDPEKEYMDSQELDYDLDIGNYSDDNI